MSSMTDIVFLLLVFFMLTSPVITPEALDLILPKAKGKTTNKHELAVSINKDMQMFINQEQIRKENLELELQKRLQSVETPTIILRAEESVPIQEAVYVMDVAKRNQFKVVLAVKP